MTTEDEAVELTESQFETAIPASVRRGFMRGRFESGADVVVSRRFVGLMPDDVGSHDAVTATPPLPPFTHGWLT